MHRRTLIAGNWKMHLTIDRAVALASSIAEKCRNVKDREIMVAPPFTALAAVAGAVKGSPVLVGGQNVCWEKEGAFTGEISPVMLRDGGATMVLVGHSERRHVFGENDALINRRVRGALRHELVPVLCVGETLDEREDGRTFAVLEHQLRAGLAEVSAGEAARLVIAYEPVWAIGTGRTASREQAQEAHSFLRGMLAGMYEKKLADTIRILYGGSVKPENIDSLMAEPDIDGALVGGAALQAESFVRIVQYTA